VASNTKISGPNDLTGDLHWEAMEATIDTFDYNKHYRVEIDTTCAYS